MATYNIPTDSINRLYSGDILNCPHDNPWHYTDVFHHTMDVVKRVPKTFELR